MVNLLDYDAEELLASPEWSDNLWALGAKGDHRKVLHQVLLKLLQIENHEQRATALAEVTAFSAIMKLDELLQQHLKEFTTLDIDLRQNAVIRPLLEEAEALGRNEGRQEGLHEGSQNQFLQLLEEKFGPLPTAVIDRVRAASPDLLGVWTRRILRANSIEETLA